MKNTRCAIRKYRIGYNWFSKDCRSTRSGYFFNEISLRRGIFRANSKFLISASYRSLYGKTSMENSNSTYTRYAVGKIVSRGSEAAKNQHFRYTLIYEIFSIQITHGRWQKKTKKKRRIIFRLNNIPRSPKISTKIRIRARTSRCPKYFAFQEVRRCKFLTRLYYRLFRVNKEITLFDKIPSHVMEYRLFTRCWLFNLW